MFQSYGPFHKAGLFRFEFINPVMRETEFSVSPKGGNLNQRKRGNASPLQRER